MTMKKSMKDNTCKTTCKGVMLMALFAVHCLSLIRPQILMAQTWDEGYENQPLNLRYESQSPTRIAYNSVGDYAVANISYSMTKGDFHTIDASGKAHTIGAYVGGLRRMGQFDVQGFLSYQNIKENEQSWNSTLWNLPLNPFVLCDSVPGDATTDAYHMGVAAAYTFSDRLKAGLKINLSAGSRADQADPRPRTVTSLLPITAGIDYRLSPAWTVGVAGGVTLFSSVIEYTKASPLNGLTTRYFLMKGMGDYAKRSSGDEPGYKRDYKGTSYHAALNACWQPGDSQWADFAEVAFHSNREDATDGGTSYSFHGGDYSETLVKVSDRLQWKPNANTLHNLTLTATMANGKATWYDQKRELDLELSSAVFYRVLSQSTIQKNQRLTATIAYQLDLMSNGRRNLTVGGGATVNNLSRKQFMGTATPKQKIQTVDLHAQAAKTIYINKVTLLAQFGGAYRISGNKDFAHGSAYTGEDDIERVYTRRIFEYESAASLTLHAMADASMVVSDNLKAGLYARCRYQRYTGNEEYWQGYDGTSLSTVDFGVYLKF